MDKFRFGTVGSPTTTPPKPGGSVGAIHRLSELELNALELGWVQSVRVSEDTCRQIKHAGQLKDIAISVHAPYFINLNANEEEWIKSKKRLMDAAYFGYLAGATDIIFHPGSYFNLPPDQVLPISVQRLRECVDELRLKDILVTLRPETMGKKAMLGSLEDTLRMSVEIPGVLPCLDFAHLHARKGDGTLNTYDEWIKVLDTYQSALGQESLYHLHIHLSGIEYGEKGEKEHLPIQESDLNIQQIFQALKDMNCSGRILCESPILEKDAIYLRDIYREMERL